MSTKTDFFELYDVNGKRLVPDFAGKTTKAIGLNLGEGLSNKVRMSLLEKPEPEIHLFGVVNEQMADYVRTALEFLYAETAQPPLKALITTTGGSVNAGMEIGGILSEYVGGTHGYVQGYAYSAGAQYILAGCLISYAHKYSRLMCHYVSAGLTVGENDLVETVKRDQLIQELIESNDEQALDLFLRKKELSQILKDLKTSNDQTVEILMNKTERSEQEVRKLLCLGEIITAKEAKEFGLVNAIYSYKVKKKVDKDGSARYIPVLVVE
jgi:ATP-dependent protease ClpP protease subunit